MKKLLLIVLFLSSCLELFSQDDLMKYNSEKIEFIKISKKDFESKEFKTNEFVADTNVIKKRNGKFELKTTSKVITISDTITADETGNSRYKYIGKNDCINQYIIERILYESNEYYFVDKVTGSLTYIWNLPKISPTCKYICSLNLIWGMDSYSGGILILKKDNMKTSLENYFKIDFDNWVSIDGYWNSKTEFYLKIIHPDYYSYSYEQRVAKENEDKIKYWKVVLKE